MSLGGPLPQVSSTSSSHSWRAKRGELSFTSASLTTTVPVPGVAEGIAGWFIVKVVHGSGLGLGLMIVMIFGVLSVEICHSSRSVPGEVKGQKIPHRHCNFSITLAIKAHYHPESKGTTSLQRFYVSRHSAILGTTMPE